MNLLQKISRRSDGYGVIQCAWIDGGAMAVACPESSQPEMPGDDWDDIQSRYDGCIIDYGPLGYFAARNLARKINVDTYRSR